MRRILGTLIILCMLLQSCHNSPIKGNKYYLMYFNPVNFSISEYQLYFKTNDIVDIKTTAVFYGGVMNNYKKNPSIMDNSTVYHYSLKDDVFEIPERKLVVTIKFNDDGSFISNTGEKFYTTSVVETDKNEQGERVESAMNASRH